MFLIDLNRVLPISFIVLFVVSCNTIDLAPPGDFDKTEALELVNTMRLEGCNCGNGMLPPVVELSWNNLLEQAAQNHANDMYKNNFFDHVGSDNSTWSERVSKVGYKWLICGENIMEGTENPVQAITVWKESSGHCENIMNGQFTEIGIARQGTYWTMVLAAPL